MKTIEELRKQRDIAEQNYREHPNPYWKREALKTNKALDKALFAQLKKTAAPVIEKPTQLNLL